MVLDGPQVIQKYGAHLGHCVNHVTQRKRNRHCPGTNTPFYIDHKATLGIFKYCSTPPVPSRCSIKAL